MVISTVNQVVYNGDGITTAWPFTFQIIDATDIKLLLIDADGTETDVSADYYVDMVNNTVYYPGYAPGAEPPEEDQPPKVQTGQKLVVYRELPITQEADLGDKWPFKVIENGLDKLTMILQQIFDWWGRTLKISQGGSVDGFDTNVYPEAGKVIAVNEDGTGFEAREALMEVNGAWDGEGRQIHSVADPTADQDAATKNYVDTLTDNNFMKLQPDGEAWEARNLPISNVAGPALVRDAANKDYVDRILAGYSGQGDRFVFFDNVEQMQAAKPVPSQMAVTLGYYDVNDGGAGVYTIRDIGADTPDGGSIIAIPDTDYVAELINDGAVNVKQFGAKGDGITDDYDAISNAITKFSKIIIPDGTYCFSNTIEVPEGRTITGHSSDSVLLYQGTDVAILLKGIFCNFYDFILQADSEVVSTDKVGFMMNYSKGSPRTITNVIINGLEINNFTSAAINLNVVWNDVISNTKISGGASSSIDGTTYGIIFDYDGQVLANWSSSGCRFTDLYIEGCSYGMLLNGDWDTYIANCIFEDNYCPIQTGIYGTAVTLINGWFENNGTDMQLKKPMLIVGGRQVNYVESGNYSNAILPVDGVITYKGNTICRLGTTQATNMISGSAVATINSTFVEGLNMNGYSSYYTGKIVGDPDHLSSKLSLGATGDMYGSGRSFGELRYSAAVIGASGDKPLREVFKIDNNGSITPEDTTVITTVGASNKMYTMGYFKNITLLGDDGNNYKISVDSGGNLVATQI